MFLNIKIYLFLLVSAICVFNMYLVSYKFVTHNNRISSDFLRTEPEDDYYHQLIDLKDFEFIINPKEKCYGCEEGLLLVLLVYSRISNINERTAIRETWGMQTDCIKVLFFFGTSEDKNVIAQLQEESEKYQDIVQGNFIDSYRNLTYKHIMELKWIKYHCHQAKFFAKVDDDIFVNVKLLYNNLKKKMWRDTKLMACSVYYEETNWVFRNNSKWSVTKEEYPFDKYPDYCDGPFIVYSADVASLLLEESYKVPFFWIEDVYVTGLLAKRVAELNHVNLKQKWYLYRTDTLFLRGPKYVKPFIYGPYSQSPEDLYNIWTALSAT